MSIMTTVYQQVSQQHSRDGASSLGFGWRSAPPACNNEAALAMPLSGLLGSETKSCPTCCSSALNNLHHGASCLGVGRTLVPPTLRDEEASLCYSKACSTTSFCDGRVCSFCACLPEQVRKTTPPPPPARFGARAKSRSTKVANNKLHKLAADAWQTKRREGSNLERTPCLLAYSGAQQENKLSPRPTAKTAASAPGSCRSLTFGGAAKA